MVARTLAPFYPEGPISFTLGSAVFTCDPDPPPAVVAHMVFGLTTDKRGYREYHHPTLLRALFGLVPDDQHNRLRRVLVDKRRPVTGPVLGRVVIWAAETTMGRPTVPSGGWSPGRRQSGATSTATCSATVYRWTGCPVVTCSTSPTP